MPNFISCEEWPSSSPDLNPLDYALWSKLEYTACSKPHTDVDALKRSLRKAWDQIPMETVRKAIDEWRPRLTACVQEKGHQFEHCFH